MLQTGVVMAAQGGKLTVAFERPQACKDCGQCGGERRKQTELTLPGEGRVGDLVTVDVPDGRVAQAAALAYVIPLAGLLLGLLLAGPLRPALAPGLSDDLFAALCAGAGLLVSLGVLRLVDGCIRGRAGWQPRLVDVRAPEPSVAENVYGKG
ncbi:MAG: SoxR reducing system RseC family protein [Oscillospiraceae bacterium]|nr:SoxR reducing system RseC family protein [Oscillospiraceae bacterium]